MSGGGRGQLGRDLLIDLCDGQAVSADLIAVDLQVDGRIAAAQTVGRIREALGAVDDLHDLFRQLGDGLGIRAVDLDGQAAVQLAGQLLHAADLHGGRAALDVRHGVFQCHAGRFDLGRGQRLVQHDVDLIGSVAVGGAQQVGDGAGQTQLADIHAGHAGVGGDADFLHMLDIEQGLGGLSGDGVGLFLGDVLAGGDGHDGLIAGDGGQKLHAHGEDLPAAEGQQDHCRHQRQGTVLETPFQTLGVLILDLIEPLELLRLGLFQDRGSRRRDHRDSHDEGGHQAVADAQGHGLQQTADDAGREHDRQEHTDRR